MRRLLVCKQLASTGARTTSRKRASQESHGMWPTALTKKKALTKKLKTSQKDDLSEASAPPEKLLWLPRVQEFCV